jgi:hypothetical protein
MKSKRALALVAALVPLLATPAMADPVYTEDDGLSKQAFMHPFVCLAARPAP